MDIYCVYLTTYSGNRLPPFYIGSSSEHKILNGYRGSVKSKQYSKIWKEELKNNPNLFKTKIISKHADRKKATEKENFLQKSLNVVKSSLYINMSIAAKEGFFGMDVSGTNNPNYGKKPADFDFSNYRNPKSTEHKNKLKKPKTELHKKNLSISKKGYKEPEQLTLKRSLAISKTYIALSPEKEIYVFRNINDFCKENNLIPQNAGMVARGIRNSHKKWKFYFFDLKILENLIEKRFDC